MFATKNDLPENVRHQSEALLQIVLSDAIDLQMQAKQAHWNIRGPRFFQLHELFDQVYAHAVASVDLIAERIVQLGGQAEGTVDTVAKNSSLPDFPPQITDEKELLVVLSESVHLVAQLGRRAINQAAEWDDTVTSDILTELVRGLDKDLWMLESHLSRRDRDDVKRIVVEPGENEFLASEGWRVKGSSDSASNY